MDSALTQLFFEDGNDEFNELLENFLLPITPVPHNDKELYNQIYSACLTLASELSDDFPVAGDAYAVDESDISPKNFLNKTRKNYPPKKRRRVLPKRFLYQTNAEPSSEFVDSDIEDEQIQKFLRSRQKRRLGRKLHIQQPDPRIRVKELRLLDHFQDKSDGEFYHYLRITKLTYRFLLDKIKETNLFVEYHTGRNYPIQADQAFQMFLYYMGNQCTYKFLSDMYHISESAIMSSFIKCVEGINRLDDSEVKWPSTSEELESIQQDFKNIAGIPGVVGSIGGCCVEMRTKREPPAGYKIGKLRSIMYLLAVADPQLRFIYMQAGFPGTFSVQEAFESSSLGDMMKTNSSSLFGDKDTHLIGTADFTLHQHLLVPYPETTPLTDMQITFNRKLAESDVCSKAFCLLKNRFSSLYTQVYANLEKIPNIIKACCIVHNIALRDPEDEMYRMRDYKDIHEDYSLFRDDLDFIPTEPEPEAYIKRDEVAEQIYQQS